MNEQSQAFFIRHLMIYETTYMDKPTLYLINQEVGKSYSFFSKLKMGGVGSKRMQIVDFSQALSTYRMPSQDTQFGFIEIRPGGVLILINRHLQNFTWPIKFEDLKFSGDQDLKIGTEDEFVVFQNGNAINKDFLSKLSI